MSIVKNVSPLLLLAASFCHATAPAAPQIYLGVPQPVAGRSFNITVLVEQAGDAAPAATGTVTVNFGDGTSGETATLVNSEASFQHSYAAAGLFSIRASYSGDSATAPGTSTQAGVVLQNPLPAVTLSAFAIP